MSDDFHDKVMLSLITVLVLCVVVIALNGTWRIIRADSWLPDTSVHCPEAPQAPQVAR